MIAKLQSKALAVPILAVAFLLALSLPAAAGAEKETLLQNPGGFCNTGATSGTPTDAFAVINFPNNNVMAEVSIKDGVPNATYQVNLVQTPSGESCFDSEATLTTNGNGHGNVHLSEPLLPGTTGAFVQVFTATGSDNRDTMDVPVS